VKYIRNMLLQEKKLKLALDTLFIFTEDKNLGGGRGLQKISFGRKF